MKKLVILLIVLICVLFLAIGSCVFAVSRSRCSVWLDDSVDEYGFFGQSRLDKLDIPDLPKIQGRGATSLVDGIFRFTATEEEFEEYSDDVYTYLSGRNFYYFGSPDTIINSSPEKFTFMRCSEKQEFLKTDICKELSAHHDTDIAYFFVWGDQPSDPVITNLENYMIIGFSRTANELNAFVRLPSNFFDYIFYLPSLDTEEILASTANEDFGLMWSLSGMQPSQRYAPMIVADSRAKLDSFILLADSSYNLTSPYGGLPAFSQSAESFDQQFFEENILIIIAVKRDIQLNPYSPIHVYLDKTTKIIINNSEDHTTPRTAYPLIIGVSIAREDLRGTEGFTAIYRID